MPRKLVLKMIFPFWLIYCNVISNASTWIKYENIDIKCKNKMYKVRFINQVHVQKTLCVFGVFVQDRDEILDSSCSISLSLVSTTHLKLLICFIWSETTFLNSTSPLLLLLLNLAVRSITEDAPVGMGGV